MGEWRYGIPCFRSIRKLCRSLGLQSLLLSKVAASPVQTDSRFKEQSIR